MKIKEIILFMIFSLIVIPSVYANIIFPAIAHQFAISLIIPSYFSVIVAVSILFIEALFIKKTFAINFLKAFSLSFIINLLSSVVGFLLVSFGEFPLRMSGITIFGYADMRLGTYIGLLPGYFLTVLIEWPLLILFLMKNKLSKPKITLRISFLMNLASYVIILISICIADILTNGVCFKTY